MQLFKVYVTKPVTTDMFAENTNPEIEKMQNVADVNQDEGNQNCSTCPKST